MPTLAKLKIWTSLLLIILAAAMLGACGSSTPEASSTANTTSPGADRVEVVYFHRSQRCNSCIYAESRVRYTLDMYFREELAANKIIFRLVNLEDKKNAAMVSKYGAFTSSLFTNVITDGTDHIDEVKEIWYILGNDKAVVEVIKGKIEESLAGISDGAG